MSGERKTQQQRLTEVEARELVPRDARHGIRRGDAAVPQSASKVSCHGVVERRPQEPDRPLCPLLHFLQAEEAVRRK